MPQVIVRTFPHTSLVLSYPLDRTCISVDELKEEIRNHSGIPVAEQRLLCGGRTVKPSDMVLLDPIPHIFDVKLRIEGGKGGFGSLLRGGGQPGAKKKKASNNGACRDLSGRRIRHVKQEEELKKWNEEQREKEAEKKSKKLSATDKLPVIPLASFNEEASLVSDMVTSAVQEGLKKVGTSPPIGTKRSPLENLTQPPMKRMKEQEIEKNEEETPKKEIECKKEVPISEEKEEKINVDNLDLAGLKALGLESLKNQLSKRGLKSGGTLEQRAERLLAIRGLHKSEWNRSLFAKKVQRK